MKLVPFILPWTLEIESWQNKVGEQSLSCSRPSMAISYYEEGRKIIGKQNFSTFNTNVAKQSR